MSGFFLQFRVTTAGHWGQTISHSQPQQGALKSTVIMSVTLLLLLMCNNNNNNNMVYIVQYNNKIYSMGNIL
jgi:hypothetical protein